MRRTSWTDFFFRIICKTAKDEFIGLKLPEGKEEVLKYPVYLYSPFGHSRIYHH